VDELRPLQVAERQIAGGKVPESKSPFLEAWRGRGIAGKAVEWIDHGTTNDLGVKTSKSLREVLVPVAKDLDNFQDYAVSVQGLDVLAKRGTKAMPLPAADYHAVVDAAPAHYAGVLKELVSYQDSLLSELVDSGLISGESAQAMRVTWPNHVPLYRRVGPGGPKGTGRGQANLPPAIRRLKGSGRDIINPVESIVKDTFTMLSLAQRNRVMTKLVDLAAGVEGAGRWIEKVPAKMYPTKVTLAEVLGARQLSELRDLTNINPEATATIFRPANLPAGKENIVRVFRNGKGKLYQLDPELHAAVTAQDAASANILVKILSTPASILRVGATTTPEFAVRNPLRDMWSAMVYSEVGLKPWDFVRGLAEVVKKGDLYHQWRASGGAHSMMVSMDRDYMQGALRDIVRRAPAERVIDALRHPIESMRIISEWTEQATRVGEFGKEVGWKQATEMDRLTKAAIQSRDITIDFSRAGTAGKQINRVTAFWNATVGGTDKMVRSFQAHPTRTTLRAVSYITVPTIVLYLVNRNDPRYQERSEWEKDLFWFIPTPKGMPLIRIPKPFELGLLFGAVPERFMRWVLEKDPHAFDQLARDVYNGISPGVIPTALIPWIEVAANQSFTGAPIVPRREQDMPKELQFGAQTTGLARKMGEWMGASPRELDYLAQGYTGGLGMQVLKTASALMEKAGLVDIPPRPASLPSDWPLLRGLLTNQWASPVQVTRMYDRMSALDHQEKLTNAGRRDPLSDAEADELSSLKARAKALSEERKAVRAIQEAKTNEELDNVLSRIEMPMPSGNIHYRKRAALLFLRNLESGLATGKTTGGFGATRSRLPGLPRMPRMPRIETVPGSYVP